MLSAFSFAICSALSFASSPVSTGSVLVELQAERRSEDITAINVNFFIKLIFKNLYVEIKRFWWILEVFYISVCLLYV